ncbi:MAG: hypothetical protein DI534_03175 [Leifsonia xyli]|nr:MAG: hypothetical protein DI534_03175 [Leifsonia xyli]
MLAVLVVGFMGFAYLYADVLWFDQLGYLSVLTTQWWAIAVLFLIGFAAMALTMWVSIFVAFRSRPLYQKLNSQLDRYQQVIEPLRRLAMIGVPALLGLFVGVSTAARWATVLQFLNRTEFGKVDPQFGLDVSFYVYELPFYRGLVAYASAIVLIAGIAAIATHYLYGGIRINGREVRVTRAARIQIAITAAVYVALQAVSIWLDQFATLTDDTGAVTGATYTDVNAGIPGRVIVAGIAVLVAVLFLVTAAIGRWRLPLIGAALLIVSSLVVGTIYPAIVQRLTVDPNAKQVEAQYIQRSIDATRAAYGLDNLDVVPYDAVTTATAGQLREDAQTTASIRILDPAIVSPTFRQLQRVKQYYQFATHLDVDRYQVDGQSQDTVIAVRELNQAGQSNQGWYNNTLVYTHGYGVVAAYGNKRASDGSPEFLESGIPSTGALGDFKPQIYFGENSPAYSIVGAPEGATPIEIDYPRAGGEASDANAATTTFDGNGGPLLDNVVKKLAYAVKFQSADLLLSDAVTDKSQILYDRDPLDRVKKVAPYLTLDTDTYPAIVDGRIVWIVDGYTTTADYPYSSIQQLSSTIADTYTPSPQYPLDDINYIRNSVKATVDAYDGSVTLYAWDTEDPLLKTWQKIFPSTLKPASAMSEQLTSHVRYPADLFKAQRAILQTYHVDDAGTFYSGDNAWATPEDPTQSTGVAQPPYYLTMQVPGTDNPAFSIYSTYIPKRQANDAGQSVLTGYLTANADAGKDYGKLTLLTLPTQDTVPGPGQVQSNFNSNTTVATELNLLNQQGSKVTRGNLLTVPVGGGLLYVQPVYVASTGETSYPLLRKVLVAFGDKVAFDDTLDGALDTIFGGDSGASGGDAGTGTDQPDGGGTDGGGTDGSGGGTGTDGGSGSTTDNAALQQALKDYQKALSDRTAAYAKGDLVAAAEADQRMQKAVEAAIVAAG